MDHGGGEEDEEEGNGEVGEDFADDDFGAAEGSDEELGERAGLAFAGDRAGHEGDGEELEDEADDPWGDVFDEAEFGIKEDGAVDGPGFDGGEEGFASGDGEFFAEVEDFLGEVIDDFLATGELEVAEVFFEGAFELWGGGGI